ncbi:helix-turn-helix domain-containing protein [Vibrio gangliei]|uniref:helix-turn-helix domain-containing protein n=1 Tax=Vibrio gangliei TaxID=2077090 RepID=UPI000D0147AA|nr:helix-turn-helix domain-containing protein [Vibrio gangliei]
MVRFLLLIVMSFSVQAIESDAIFYSLPSQTQGHFLTVKKVFPNLKGGIWVQDIRNRIYYFDGQHFSPLPSHAFSHGIEQVSFSDNHFWFIEGGRLIQVDTSGKSEVKFEAPNGEVLQALGQSQDLLWMYGAHTFYIFDPKTGESHLVDVSTVTQSADPANNGIQTAVFVNNKWVVANHESLFYLDTNGPRRILPQQFSHIQVLKFDPSNTRLLVGTQSGLFSINLVGITPEVQSIVSGQVQSVLITGRDYWVGTKQGLYVYQKNIKATQYIAASYQNELVLSNNNIIDLAEDKKGGVWIATAKGLNYYSQSSDMFKRVRFGSRPDQLPFVHINEVAAIDDHSAWLASTSGLYRVTVNNAFAGKKQKVEKLLDLDISHLSQVGDSLWISYNDKLIRFDIATNKLYVVREQDKWSPNTITHLTADSQGKVWLSTQQGLYRYSPQSETTESFGLEWMVDKYGPSSITRLSSGNQGRVWIGTDHGVYLHQGQEIVFDARSANDGEVISLSESARQRLWVASHYGLRNMVANDLFQMESSMLTSTSVPLCTIGSHSGTWVTTTQGLDYYSPESVLVNRFSSPLGLVTNEFLPDGCSLSPSGNTLVLASKLGLLFSSTSTLKNSQLPEDDVLIGQLQIDHELVTVAPQTQLPIEVDYGHSISVLFGVLPNFEMPQLQYRLVGSDKDHWVDFQGSQLTFEHLEPGQYSLEFKTPSQVGTRTQAAQYVFNINKPWYMLPWTIALLVLLLLASIIAMVVWRSKSMLRTNLRLRRVINLKTQQLRHQSQLLVRSNMQLRKQAQTRKTLVGDRIYQSKSWVEQILQRLTHANLTQDQQVLTEYAQQALEPLEQVLALYRHKNKCSAILDGQVVSLVLKAVVNGWQQEADKSGITLLAEDNTQGCVIKVKQFNLDQILNTLMASALIRSNSNQIIYVSARLADKKLRITIEDTGDGVSDEEVSAFEKLEFGDVDDQFAQSFSDTSLCAIAYMAYQSGGQFDFHCNQLTHVTQLSITWPVEECEALMEKDEKPSTRTMEAEPSVKDDVGFESVHVEGAGQGKNNDWLAKAYHLVELHYSDPSFSTSSAAKMLYLSERSLQRKFKLLTGGSFMDYVTKVRLEKACDLLMAGEKISDTAYETGFNDPSYFSQKFKHHFGLSPSQFVENSVG